MRKIPHRVFFLAMRERKHDMTDYYNLRGISRTGWDLDIIKPPTNGGTAFERSNFWETNDMDSKRVGLQYIFVFLFLFLMSCSRCIASNGLDSYIIYIHIYKHLYFYFYYRQLFIIRRVSDFSHTLQAGKSLAGTGWQKTDLQQRPSVRKGHVHSSKK